MTLSLFPATSPEPAAGPDVAYTPAALADTILRYLTAQAWHARCPWYYDPHCGDGAFLSCTVDRDQQPSVLAWAQHETDGVVEWVASIPYGDRTDTHGLPAELEAERTARKASHAAASGTGTLRR